PPPAFAPLGGGRRAVGRYLARSGRFEKSLHPEHFTRPGGGPRGSPRIERIAVPSFWPTFTVPASAWGWEPVMHAQLRAGLVGTVLAVCLAVPAVASAARTF